MKTIARITGVAPEEVGSEVFAELLRIYPMGAPYRAFMCALPVDDRRVNEILATLEQAGLTPWRDYFRPMDATKEFRFELDREYDVEDLAGCQFLELAPQSEACNPGARTRDDHHKWMEIPEIHLPEKSFDVYFGRAHWYFVASRVKEMLEAGLFSDLRFRPTYFIPRDLTADDTNDTVRARYGTPYWEIDSERTLPPLAPSMQLVDFGGNRIKDHDFSRGVRAIEGLYVHPELHYRRSDLERIQPVDLARTFEPLGGLKDRSRVDGPLVASQRFINTVCSVALEPAGFLCASIPINEWHSNP